LALCLLSIGTYVVEKVRHAPAETSPQVLVTGGTNTFLVGGTAAPQPKAQDPTAPPIGATDAPDWLSSASLSNRSFRLVDVPRDGQFLDRKTYKNCTIYGPAVVGFTGQGEFGRNNFPGPGATVLWEVPDEWLANVGIMILRDCHITDCTLINIGVVAARVILDKLAQPPN
jgi:hypothetical protein